MHNEDLIPAITEQLSLGTQCFHHDPSLIAPFTIEFIKVIIKQVKEDFTS